MVDRHGLTRRQLLALTGAGATAGLAGCTGGSDDGGGGNGSGGGDSGEPIHVFTDYNNEGWQQQWEETIVPQFSERSGREVRVEYAGFSGQNESRLATLIQSGDPPALQTSTFEQIGDVWAADGLEDVSETVRSVESTAGEIVAEPYHDGQGQNASYWELPHGYYTGTFIYRQDVYDQLGLEVPTSFQGVLENAKAIDESDMDVRGYGLAGKKVGKAQDEFQTYLANMGVQELRWKDPNKREGVELWFPKEEIVTLLEFFDELAKYSPDPSGIGWSESLSGWAGGQFAQQYHLNMWPGGVASEASEELARNTKVAPMPLWEEGGIAKGDSMLSSPTVDGWHLFTNADNTQGGRELLEWMYAGSLERTAGLYEAEPTRFLPDYADVLGSETFTNMEYFQTFPSHLEQLKFVQDTIVGEYYNNKPEMDLVTSEVLQYYLRFFFQAEMVNQVVVADTPPEQAYQQGKRAAEQRIQEARERLK
ncbi:ABC transporter substrate-binding protein [Halobacteriales archaeon QS_3_64_16]|nr:MAG: ABC transporter substrate-binding protein [Halobacteriales archaeon QS_3_64_16]